MYICNTLASRIHLGSCAPLTSDADLFPRDTYSTILKPTLSESVRWDGHDMTVDDPFSIQFKLWPWIKYSVGVTLILSFFERQSSLNFLCVSLQGYWDWFRDGRENPERLMEFLLSFRVIDSFHNWTWWISCHICLYLRTPYLLLVHSCIYTYIKADSPSLWVREDHLWLKRYSVKRMWFSLRWSKARLYPGLTYGAAPNSK